MIFLGKVLGNELIPKVIEYINSGKCIPTVATVDSNGNPSMSHIGLTRVKDPKTLRLGFYNKSNSLKNILENKEMCVSIVGEGNIALTVNGKGEKIRELEGFVVVEMKITEVQSKRSPYLTVVNGIQFEDHSPETVTDLYSEILK